MVVLIDTNILLDVLEKRRGFYGMSLEILTWCASGRIKGVIALHSVSNIFFILRNNALPRNGGGCCPGFWISCRWLDLAMLM